MMRMMAFLDQLCRLDLKNSRVHQIGVCGEGWLGVIHSIGGCFFVCLFLDGGYFMFRKLLPYYVFPGNLYWDRLCLQGFVERHMKMIVIMMMKVAMLSLDPPFLLATKLIPPAVRTRMLLGPCLPEGLMKTPWHWILSAEHKE